MKLNTNGYDVVLSMGEELRIRLPERAGIVTVTTHNTTEDGHPRMRVDVESDTPHFGPADDGGVYTVENKAPGVVFVTGDVSRETEPDMCDDGCGKHVDHEDECGPR